MPTSRPWHAPWPPSLAATWWSTRASRASSTWSPNAPSRPPPPSSSFWRRCGYRATRWSRQRACTRRCPRPTPNNKTAPSAFRPAHPAPQPRQHLAGDPRLRRQPAAPGAHRGSDGCLQCHRCGSDCAGKRHCHRPGTADRAPDRWRQRRHTGGRAGPGRHLVQDHADRRAAQQRADPARRQPGPRGPGALPGRAARSGPRARQQRGQRQHPCGLSEKRRRHQTGRHPARRNQWQRQRHGVIRAGAVRQHDGQRRRGGGQRGGSGGGMASSGPGPSGSTTGSGGGLLSTSTGGSSPGQSLNAASSNQPATGGQIQADPATNSLIITAPDPQYRQLRAVIDQLDGRRAQVLVESLIVEISANKLAQFGIQWQSLLGQKGASLVGAIGTNSGQSGGNITSLTAALASGSTTSIATAANSLGQGMNLLLAPRINGQYYLGALANFLQNSGDANVLSTPNLMTLDNEEAKIVIGNNELFLTGAFSNSSSNSTVNPFTTVQRRDVGLMLRVRPQINENGTVKLSVYQEVSKIDASTLTSTNGPTTSKRSIESNVLVEDGSIIVIGGLLEDSYSLNQDKVPVLGDMPVLGNLFRSEKRTRNKTNLMIFLRPTVLRSSASSDILTADRYDAIRALQLGIQPVAHPMLDAVDAAP